MIEQLLAKHRLISDQVNPEELRLILRLLDETIKADTPGEVVEFGCYVGTTSLFIQRLLQSQASNKHLHVYDSFAGLPEKTAPDSSPAGTDFRGGELSVSKAQFIRNFKHAGLPLPTIYKAWFDDLTDSDLPAHIAFAFLDGDFYASIQTSLQLIQPRLSPGAIVVVDDYHTEALPGARQAVDEWAAKHAVEIKIQSSLAIMRFTP